MSKYAISAFALLFAGLLTVGAVAKDKDKKEKFEAKCPISGKPIDKDASVSYKGGKVYFCCQGCPATFENNTEKFAAKANHQLYGTGQAKEVKCPLTGRKLNPGTAIEVSGVTVAFCCNNCKAKAQGTEGEAQIALIFSDKAFEKGFEVQKKKEKQGDN